MNFSFENQGTYTYLVYAIEPDDKVDTLSLGMLTNNKITGLAPALFTQMDATKYIKYNVSARISVKQFFAGSVNRKRLLGVFSGIVNGLLSAEDYMIDTNFIMLDLDYIFVDVSTCNTVLICLPVEKGANGPNSDLGMFFKNIMFSIRSDQTENCDHVAKIINYLNSAPVFSLVDFKKVLDDIGEINASQSASMPVSSAVQPVQEARPVVTPVQPRVASTPLPQPLVTPSTVQQPVKLPDPQPVSKQSVSVPPAASNTESQQNISSSQPEGKPISMLTLLMHYNKENAAAYKAQQAAKKANKQKNTPTPVSAGFNVPGMPAQNEVASPKNSELSTGFAIPGQPTPQPAPVMTSSSSPTSLTQTQPSPQPIPQPIPALQPPAPAQQPVFPQGQPMNFGETTVLNNGKAGETTVLNSSKESEARRARPYLIRIKSGEKIILDKPVFRIGKERSYVDYFIGDNTAVSRSHVNIISRNGERFIVDTNSTNHTYVNGTMIQSNEETKLSPGDRIHLANEAFDFKVGLVE